MGGIRSAAAAALIALALFIAACGGSGATRDNESGQQTSDTANFATRLTGLCAALDRKTAEAQAATDRAAAEELSRELLDAQRLFVEKASALTPPEAVAEPYSDYLAGMRSGVSLNERSIAGTSDDRKRLRLALGAAEVGVEMFEAKETADLPDSCPPASGAEAYAFLFQAQANLACFKLVQKLERLARATAVTQTRAATVRFIQQVGVLTSAHASAIENAVPSRLSDEQINEMIQLYEARTRALERLARAFRGTDEEEFQEAFREQQELSARADEIAAALGLEECTGFVALRS